MCFQRANSGRAMTLILSMNPFLDPEEDLPVSYAATWASEPVTCQSSPAAACSSLEDFQPEGSCRRFPDHLSRIAFFKRKLVDHNDIPFPFRTCCQTVAPVLEERAQVLRLSLDKMRFIDDPEAFLRRSVLINNLLRRLRAEILLQGFPLNPPFPPFPSTAHQASPPRICLAPPTGPPLRKRLRVVRGGRADLQTCCCFCSPAAAGGHCLHLPFSVHNTAPSSLSTFRLQPSRQCQAAGAVDDQGEEGGSSAMDKGRTRMRESRMRDGMEDGGVTHCRCQTDNQRLTSHRRFRRLHRP